MRKLITAVAVGALALVPLVVVAPASAKLPTASKKLLWSAEFNGKAGQRPGKFGFKFDLGYSNGWGNSEVQYYTNAATFSKTDGKGNMVISAKRIPLEDPVNVSQCGLGCEFKSARIQTRGKVTFQYGRLEARIKAPAGVGTWPAFWLLGNNLDSAPWPECGEIDIMEGRGSSSTMLWGTIHGPGYSGGSGITNTYITGGELSAEFHTYAIEWQKNSIKWYFDNHLYHQVTNKSVGANKWVFNRQFFMILNLAMGGTFGGDTDPQLQGAKMYIDYVRYYKLGSVGTVKVYK